MLLTAIGLILPVVLLMVGLDAGVFKKAYDYFFPLNDELWYMDKEEMDTLVCDANKKPLNISDLPVKHRTIKLRFLDLKSRVCRPFSS
jgi:hypothetical protein